MTSLIMLLLLIFFNPQFLHSAVAIVNYYHINRDWGRMAKVGSDRFPKAGSLKTGKWKKRGRCKA